jgi:hypothetical protein
MGGTQQQGGVRIDLSLLAQALIVASLIGGGGWTINSVSEIQRQQDRMTVILEQLASDRSDVAVRVRALELAQASQAPRRPEWSTAPMAEDRR